MKNFKYTAAESFEEAGKLKKDSENTVVMAGGTDLLGIMKDAVLPDFPEDVVDLKRIPEGAGISCMKDTIKIGALTRLSDICASQIVKKAVPGLAEAAHSVATPQIRNVATIGGNLCQDVRCWYYRYPHDGGGRIMCMRKGGDHCYAEQGDNRYHSVFGGMRTGSSQCTSKCPAGINIADYMEQIRGGNWDEAARIIMRANPMPMMTSRICPHLCKEACNQGKYGEAVNIPGVERSVGDYILEHKEKFYQTPEKETGKKAAVIGAGPGGLAAAYYLRSAGHQVTVYDRMEKPGGILRYGIPHYRLPKSIVDDFCKALESMGVVFKMGVDVGKDITVEDIKAKNDSVYFGTGAWKQPILGITGEELTTFGLNFLVEVNTYLTKTIGQDILVCGGGNVAMDVALTARRLGARSVKLICLESREEMPASPEEVAMAEEEGVLIFNRWGLGTVVTGNDGKVCGLEAKKCLSVFNDEHRFDPKYDDNEKKVFKSDFIVLATGQRVDTSFLGEKLSSQLKTPRGLLNADVETGKTAEKGYYAGGDAVTGPNIAIRAIRAGHSAAASMNSYLGAEPSEPKDKTGFIHYDQDGIKKEQAYKLPSVPLGERTLTKEDFASYSAETVLQEAERCMNCGCYSVSPSDIVPMLIALDAIVKTTLREEKAEKLFASNLKICEALKPGEIVEEIDIQIHKGDIVHFDKFRLRDSVDFSLVSLGSVFSVENGKIKKASLVFGGVAPIPYRAVEAEKFLVGREIGEETAEKAAELAVKDASPLSNNAYKVAEMKTMLKDAVKRAGMNKTPA